MPGYMSVYSWVSPAMAAFRLSRVRPIGSPVAGSPDLLEILQVAMSVTGLALGGGAEHRRNVVLPFHVRLVGEVQVAAVGLRLAGEGGLEIVFGLAALERFHETLLGSGSPFRLGCERGH